jgi:monoamine oxidase
VARTPLMRALERLASEHNEASRRNIPVEQVREERALARQQRADELTRREFLGGVAAAGAAAALGGALAGSLGARPVRGATTRVAIVGGGIAGLTTALMLADKGVGSTIYEASSSRVGGRLHSDTGSSTIEPTGAWADGQTSEWCGELIDTSHKTVLSLAQRYRLKTVDLLGAEPNGSEDTYKFDGSYYPKSQADTDFKAIHQALSRDTWAASYPTTFEINTPEGIALDNMSIYDWIESRVPGGHRSPFGQLLDIAYNIEFGAETTVQSSLNLIYLLGYNSSPGNVALFGGSDERYHIIGGNESLPRKILADISTRGVGLRQGWRMTSVARRSDGGVALSFDTSSGSQSVTADHVVLALPFAVLRTLDYRRAGFDDRKKKAIQELGRGHNGKLQLQFTSRRWNGTGPWPGISNGSTYADTGYQNTWDVSRGQPGTSGILVDYTGGNVTDSYAISTPYNSIATNSAVASYADRFLQQIAPVLPGLSWNGRATLSVPHKDPNLNCSYSFWRVGQCHTIGGSEGLRQRNIHFAGEHTSVDFQGWIEGGAITGVRAAGEILADLK